MHSLENLGWSAFFDRQLSDEERARWTPARVVWEGRGYYRLSATSGDWSAQLAGRLRHTTASRADLPVVGDWVLAAFQAAEQRGTIHRRLRRRSQFSRTAAGRSTNEQIVAANIDTLLVVTSFNRDFNLRRLERYLALAWESGATPIVVLNKADLCTAPEAWLADAAPICQGVTIVMTSAMRGDGIAALQEVVRTGGTTALVGSSGVGKSTLLNALLGDGHQDVLPIRSGDDRGRHSTTARQLFCLPGGGVLIDTPGMRELQLWDASGGIEHVFAEIQELSAACRFRNCSHASEPGCAVISAVERGLLPAERLASFHRLQREEIFLRSRHDEGGTSEHKRKAKYVAKSLKLLYKLRRR